jgi:hypothetical protein
MLGDRMVWAIMDATISRRDTERDKLRYNRTAWI